MAAKYPALSYLRKEYGFDNVCVLCDQPSGLPRGVVLTHCYYAVGVSNYFHVLARRSA